MSQGRTDNSWGPRAIGDHGAPVSLPKLKKAYEKGTRGISWGPLLTPGPRALPEFPNGQSAPVYNYVVSCDWLRQSHDTNRANHSSSVSCDQLCPITANHNK
ncbi:unnamed protein product [Staurois parvus]|uniref:Uncharacterized protein n=1 Tax=Staurois parvus TaxID=386267 RepID=A0ABN9BY43_9NEOB|nr:unnamed protein product [Staurois parvus]